MHRCPNMELTRVLAILLVSGLLAVDCDAACDSTCKLQCYTKLQECKVAAEDQLKELNSAASGSDTLTQCATSTSTQDACSISTQMIACIDQTLGAQCLEDATVNADIDQTKAATSTDCGAVSDRTCPADLTKCTCDIRGDAANPLGKFCTGYTKFKTCLDNLLPRCQQTRVSSMLDLYRNSASLLRYLHCPDTGGCPQATTCLNQLAFTSETDTDSGSTFDIMRFLSGVTRLPNVNLLNTCQNLNVFDCLKSASATCKLDQGDVTMDEVKTAYTDLCTNVLPQATSVASCRSFVACLNTFKGIPDLSKFTGSDGMHTRERMETIVRFKGSATRTGFWCSWLKHNYQCAIDNAKACNLSADLVSLGNQKLSQLQTTCQGAATAPPPNFDDQTGGATSVHTSVSVLTVAAVVRVLFM